jgi:hypothetical protein
VIEGKPYHCGAIVRRMRVDHLAAVERAGMDAHRELRSIFETSCVRKAWLVDGQLAALGGISGTQLSPLGFAWVVLTAEALRYPIEIVKETRRQLEQIMTVKRELATTIIGGDTAALRFAIYLGFHVRDDGPGSAARSKAGRRDLARFIESNSDLRLPVGSGYVVALGYHSDEEIA